MALRNVPDHPKFAKLKSIIRMPKYAVLGILESLWHFCGKFAPQGDIGRFSDEEIESWLEWEGEPGRLVDALIRSRWIDRSSAHRLLVHDWHEHADRTTKTYLKRAKKELICETSDAHVADMYDTSDAHVSPKQVHVHVHSQSQRGCRGRDTAADAAPSADADHPTQPEKPEKQAKARKLEKPPAGPSPQDLADLWNATADPIFPRCHGLNPKRKAAAAARLREEPRLEVWEDALVEINRSRWCRGEHQRNDSWRANFDWLLRPGTLLSIQEGKYSDRDGPDGESPPRHDPDLERRIQEALSR